MEACAEAGHDVWHGPGSSAAPSVCLRRFDNSLIDVPKDALLVELGQIYERLVVLKDWNLVALIKV